MDYDVLYNFFILFLKKTIALPLGQCCIMNSTGGDGIGV